MSGSQGTVCGGLLIRSGMCAMAADMSIYCDDDRDLESLRKHLQHLPDVTTRLVPRAPLPSRLGGGFDSLAVLFGSGGAATVVAHALKTWIESKVTVVTIKVGESEFIVKSRDAATILPQVTAALTAVDRDERS